MLAPVGLRSGVRGQVVTLHGLAETILSAKLRSVFAAVSTRILVCILALLFFTLSRAVPAQNYPTKPVRLLVPSSSGSAADVVGRILAQSLSERLGQQVVVDPRAGAGGNIAAEIAAKTSADGYTLFMAAPTHAINGSLYKNLSYDLVRDFSPIILATTTSYVVLVNTSVPAASLKELIALARAKPGQLNFASSGTGNATHLTGELLNSLAGINITHVPYKGAGPAQTDLIGGHVQIMFANLSAVLPLIRSNRVRALAVTGEKRAASAPDVPTMQEEGVPGYVATSWFGLVAPAATPRNIIARLNTELTQLLSSQGTRERLLAQGAEPIGGTPQQFRDFIQAEIEKWARLIRSTKITID
jgi:tripartite-type tricarboxylate transporter receptor subunit TctC